MQKAAAYTGSRRRKDDPPITEAEALRRRAAELHAESEAIRRQHERTADSRLH
jgi:alkylation response protein AidB-like acyl-CoA dehydrogenase